MDGSTVRVIAIALALLAIAASPARSDDDFDEDGEFAGFRDWSIGLVYTGHFSRIDGRSETGWGPSLELALGRYRWQYFVEAGVATSTVTTGSGADGARVDGSMVRGGAGARWLARQFRPGSNGGAELYLVSLVGAQRYNFEGMRVSRAEVAFGFGLQARSYKRPQLAFRLDARALNHGFMAGLGVAW